VAEHTVLPSLLL